MIATQKRKSPTPRRIMRLADIASEADAFLIDQFGTLHDGITPYHGAIEALSRLRACAKQVILLSNSGRRARFNEQRLQTLGVPRSAFDISLTSGDVAWRSLRRARPSPLDKPCRVLSLSHEANSDILDGFDVTWVQDAATADLIMLSSFPTTAATADTLFKQLRPALERNVLAICTNPDLWRLTPQGPQPGVGAIGAAYERAGGRVRWFGKPHPALFEAAFETIQHVPRERIVVVGDSGEHDIAGGAALGCRTVLVHTGVFEASRRMDPKTAAFQERYPPDFILERLR